MKRFLVVIALLIAASIIALYALKPRVGAVVETWGIENQSFRLRVDRHEERCFMVCGAYYAFYSSPRGRDTWTRVLMVHHDDPNPIPRDQVRIVNEQLGYMFFGPQYAVTLDAGRTWSVWDAGNAKTRDEYLRDKLYPWIVRVTVNQDGTGEMWLSSLVDGPEGVPPRPSLHTADHGRSWQFR